MAGEGEGCVVICQNGALGATNKKRGGDGEFPDPVPFVAATGSWYGLGITLAVRPTTRYPTGHSNRPRHTDYVGKKLRFRREAASPRERGVVAGLACATQRNTGRRVVVSKHLAARLDKRQTPVR